MGGFRKTPFSLFSLSLCYFNQIILKRAKLVSPVQVKCVMHRFAKPTYLIQGREDLILAHSGREDTYMGQKKCI